MPELPVIDEIWSQFPLVEQLWPLLLLALRVSVAALLYLFLISAFRALYSELRPPPASAAIEVAAAPRAARDDVEASPPRRPSRDWIEIVRCEGDGDLVGRRYPLEAVTVIGRRADSTAVLPDPRVSAQHARLVARDGDWWIEDLGSTNGTYIGRRRVSGPTPVDRRAELRFGPVVARLAETGRRR